MTARAAARSVTFVFFDPWTVVGGLVPAIVQAMVADGFVVLDAACRPLQEADAEEIYRPNHPVREGSQWHVARRIYGMGPSLGLLLGHRDTAVDSCERMRRLKGRANPTANAPGTLRHDFRAPNRSLSLMHSSDDEAQVERESPVFFAPARLDRARRPDTPVLGVDALGPLLALHAGLERAVLPTVGALLARLRLRAVQRLPAALRQDAAIDAAAAALERCWWTTATTPNAAVTRAPAMTAQAQDYLALVERERPLRARLAATLAPRRGDAAVAPQWHRPREAGVSSVLDLLDALARPQDYARWDTGQGLAAALVLDRWERVLLDTTLIHFDDFLA